MEALILLVIAGVIGWWLIKLFASSSGGGSVTATLAQHGATLDYQYKNLLGIDSKGERIFVLGVLFDKGEIRSVEKSSIMETKVNPMWGFQSHKDKHCKLIIHTRSLAQPML